MKTNINITTITHEAQCLILRQGNHPPTIILLFEDIQTPIRRELSPLPGTPERRQHALFVFGRQLGESYQTKQLKKVWFISEAWFHEASKEKRHEGLFVLELDVTTFQQILDVREIVRGHKKKIKALHPLQDDQSSGPVTAHGALVLAFVAGFADAASSQFSYKDLLKRIQQENAFIRFLRRFFD